MSSASTRRHILWLTSISEKTRDAQWWYQWVSVHTGSEWWPISSESLHFLLRWGNEISSVRWSQSKQLSSKPSQQLWLHALIMNDLNDTSAANQQPVLQSTQQNTHDFFSFTCSSQETHWPEHEFDTRGARDALDALLWQPKAIKFISHDLLFIFPPTPRLKERRIAMATLSNKTYNLRRYLNWLITFMISAEVSSLTKTNTKGSEMKTR